MAGINGSMAHLSDTLFTTAIAVYALAVVGYTAEYAFGRRGRVAATAGRAGARTGRRRRPAGRPSAAAAATAPRTRAVRRPGRPRRRSR